MGKNLKGKELGKNLYQRKDGRYEARAMIKGMKINFIDKDLAVVKENLEKAITLARNNVDYRKQNITLNEWFAEWFDRYKKPKVKTTSIQSIKNSYRNTFGLYLGTRQLSNVTPDAIQDVINLQRSQGKAASTMRTGLSNLSQCMERAVVNKMIDSNPCYDISVSWESEGNNKLTRFLSEDEQVTFLNHVADSWYKEMFYVMFLTGLRVGELGALRWEDVDFKNRAINVNKSLHCSYSNGIKSMFLTKPKTPNSVRSIPFMGECETMLRSQKEKQDKLRKELGDRWRSKGELANVVFSTSLGSPVTRFIAEKEIRKVVNDINLEEQINAVRENRPVVEFEHLYPHAIRHSFCSRCFQKGLNPKTVQQLMGHAHYSTTIDIYTHLTQGKIAEDAMKFDSIVS